MNFKIFRFSKAFKKSIAFLGFITDAITSMSSLESDTLDRLGKMFKAIEMMMM